MLVDPVTSKTVAVTSRSQIPPDSCPDTAMFSGDTKMYGGTWPGGWGGTLLGWLKKVLP